MPLLAIMSCGKCVECTIENSYGDNEQYTIYNSTTETFGDYIVEICSDNFESKKDFNDYIDELEDELDWTCKNDFLN